MSAEPEYASEMYDELEIKLPGLIIALVILGAAWSAAWVIWFVVKARDNWLFIAILAGWGAVIAAFFKIGTWFGLR